MNEAARQTLRSLVENFGVEDTVNVLTDEIEAFAATEEADGLLDYAAQHGRLARWIRGSVQRICNDNEKSREGVLDET